MEPHFRYFTDLAGGFGAHLSANFFLSGRVVVQTTSNYGTRTEMGVYEAEGLSDAYEALHEMREIVGFATLPDAASMSVDSPTVSLSAVGDGAFEMKAYPVNEVPPALGPMLAAARATVERVLEHPKQVVRGEARCAARSIAFGELLEIELTLRNVGREPARIDNPIAAKFNEWCGLRLRLAQEGARPGGDVFSVDYVPRDLQALTLVELAAAKVELAAGGELRLVLRRKIELPPGAYKLTLDYVSTGSHQPNTVEGGLHVSAGRLEIRPR